MDFCRPSSDGFRGSRDRSCQHLGCTSAATRDQSVVLLVILVDLRTLPVDVHQFMQERRVPTEGDPQEVVVQERSHPGAWTIHPRGTPARKRPTRRMPTFRPRGRRSPSRCCRETSPVGRAGLKPPDSRSSPTSSTTDRTHLIVHRINPHIRRKPCTYAGEQRVHHRVVVEAAVAAGRDNDIAGAQFMISLSEAVTDERASLSVSLFDLAHKTHRRWYR